ncbi:hypothetical protein [Clostridium baratii]|uniref:hypothetical protein n=1 Tax=Clostridium baratii TaxID=1561 RepID=UPI00097FA6BA|nr:hypothetical protein [Clostridium baratii]AQM59764.1 hypothetical protein NPD11_404 [Clostridium baratii]
MILIGKGIFLYEKYYNFLEKNKYRLKTNKHPSKNLRVDLKIPDPELNGDSIYEIYNCINIDGEDVLLCFSTIRPFEDKTTLMIKVVEFKLEKNELYSNDDIIEKLKAVNWNLIVVK